MSKFFNAGIVLFVLALSGSCLAAAKGGVSCAPVAGAEEAIRSGKRFLIFGEWHGTREMPAAFAEIVCAIASQRPVVVGLEYPEEMTPALSDYLASSGSMADRTQFLKDAKWGVGFQDGRKSEAMFAMIGRLRVLRASGLNVEIVSFIRPVHNQGRTFNQQPHEAGMAGSLVAAAALRPDAQIVVFVGNLHALREADDLGFDPMAKLLPQDQVLSVNFVHGGGTSWNCMNEANGKMECRTRTSSPIMMRGPRIGYDLQIDVGPISASPPAVAAQPPN